MRNKPYSVMPTIRGRFGWYIYYSEKLNLRVMNKINMEKWLEDNPHGVKAGKPKFVGKMPIRKDLEVLPERKIEWYKREFNYWVWRLFNLIPSIHRENMKAVKQWEKERQEHMDRELDHRKKLWKEGVSTYLLPLDSNFFKPYPVPRRGSLRWIVGEMVMVNALGAKRIKLNEDKNASGE